MPFKSSSDYWVEMPGGRFTLGLLPGEARLLAEEAAKQARLDPPALSHNEGKNVRKWTEWQEMDCNVDWLTDYLLAHYPQREVDIEPFAIARRPVTNAEYRVFMAETGEIEPGSWQYPPNGVEPEQSARGVDWVAAVAFANWAGARLPFEAEWERAVRGVERRLFPWGNDYSDDAVGRTPDGILVPIANELCADVWVEPAGLSRERWGEKVPSGMYRCAKGGEIVRRRRSIPSAITRAAWSSVTYGSDMGALRLVRADGRSIPGSTGSIPRNDRADLDVRSFETAVVRAALEQLRRSDVAMMHTIDLGSSNQIGWWLRETDAGASEVKSEVCRAIRGGVGKYAGGDVRAGFDPDPAVAAAHYNDGLYFVARSRETFRRIPTEHGVFVWSVGYRLAEDGQVHARHVAGFRMAFDKRIHTLTYQFRDGEVDTPISDITIEMVASGVLAAFHFYEAHADADRSPF